MSGQIVVFKKGTTPEQIEEYLGKFKDAGGEVTKKLDLINGFSAKISEEGLTSLQSFTGDGGIIDYIEPDGPVSIQSN